MYIYIYTPYVKTLANFSALRSCPAWCAIASLKYGSRSGHALLHILHPPGQGVDRNNATMATTSHHNPNLPPKHQTPLPSALGCRHVFSRVVFNALVLTPKGCCQTSGENEGKWRTDYSFQSERHGCKILQGLLWNIAENMSKFKRLYNLYRSPAVWFGVNASFLRFKCHSLKGI